MDDDLVTIMMWNDFNDVRTFFEDNAVMMQNIEIEQKIDALLSHNIKQLKYLVEDVVFFYYTMQLCKFTSYQLIGSSNSFFNITTFIRANLECTFVILGKLQNLQNKISDDYSIVEKINKISNNFFSKKEFRNRLEHTLDPYYAGDYSKIKEEFSLKEQLSFLNSIVDIIEDLTYKNIILNNEVLKLDYEPLSEEKIKEIVTSMQSDVEKNFLYAIEMSYRVQDFDRYGETYKSKEEEGKSIIDLCFKSLEINKCIIYIFNSVGIKESLKGTVKSYFSRIAITKCYQMCDKLATYIKPNEKTYFKKVCEELGKEDGLNNIEIKMLNLYKSADYDVLSKIRNFIEHKKGFVDYEGNSDIICSAIINVYKELNSIVLLIVSKYFNINGMKISERARKELARKTMIHKI